MLIFLLIRPPPTSTLFPYTTLFRSGSEQEQPDAGGRERLELLPTVGMEGIGRTAGDPETDQPDHIRHAVERDRKSTRLNSSHITISYAVFCLKKKKKSSTEYMRTEK